uniref:Stress-response A/B barrel domain-containing protein n=1 Tax=Tetraselmis sp. GSL018 TaxID=582737 RepID=A0A061SFN2_9CHLO
MWQTEVPSTLEDVYRQGDGWGEGFEHLLFVTENPRYSKDSKQHTPEMLSQLKEVAQGLRPGCVQAVPGRVEIGAEVAAPYAFMARFREAQHLDTFTASAPYQALWEANPNLPGKACMSVTFNIAPADSQSTASFGSLGL